MIEFVRDPDGLSVLVDGRPQSHVPDDPGFLVFEYVQHIATMLDLLDPPPPARIAVTHVGGAGLTLPRYVEHTRRGSPQIVFEPDTVLTEQVRREAPLPRGHRIRVRPQTGEEGLRHLRSGTAAAIVLDAFAAGVVPGTVVTADSLAHLARVLMPGGVALLNVPDEPGLAYVSRVAATAASIGLTHAAIAATHDILKGRRFGNVVLALAGSPLPVESWRRQLLRSPFPTGVRGEAEVARLRVGASPFTDPVDSPPPAGRWRRR